MQTYYTSSYNEWHCECIFDCSLNFVYNINFSKYIFIALENEPCANQGVGHIVSLQQIFVEWITEQYKLIAILCQLHISQ